MQTGQFFVDYEKYTSWLNAVVQNVKTHTGGSGFSGAQETAAIAAGGLAIDKINVMRKAVYGFQGITQNFDAYDNTLAGVLKTYQFLGTFAEIKTEMGTFLGDLVTTLTDNETITLIDSGNYNSYTKTVTYTNAETAAIAAVVDLISVIGYVAAALTNTVAPAISGTLHVGDTLTVTPGTWTGNTPIGIAHQWISADDNIGTNAANIVGQTGLTYLIDVAYTGKYITVKETATEQVFNYQTANVTATYVGPVTP